MSALSESTGGCGIPASKTSLIDVPSSNGKTQPWKEAWPPRKADLQDVAEARGQMLLLDGTGGSGTKAVPNAVNLPPKSDKAKNDEKVQEDKSVAQNEENKAEK